MCTDDGFINQIKRLQNNADKLKVIQYALHMANELMPSDETFGDVRPQLRELALHYHVLEFMKDNELVCSPRAKPVKKSKVKSNEEASEDVASLRECDRRSQMESNDEPEPV